MQANFASLPPIFKNNLVRMNYICELMKIYAKEKGKMSQSRKVSISNFTSQNVTLITLLLLFYLELGLVCTKLHHFVEYTPRNCLNSFVQSTIDARRQGTENPNSSVVAETVKLRAKSSSGHQIIDRSRATHCDKISKQLKDHATINSKLFEKLNHMNIAIF